GALGSGGGGGPRGAEHRRLARELLRGRDHAPARTRAGRRRTRGDRPLQHRRGGRPAPRRAPGRIAVQLLVLGGTRFLGRHLSAAALAQGHDLTLFTRGQTNPDLFPEAEHLRGDRDGDLAALESGTWDAVVDTSGYFPRIVRAAAETLAGRVGHYTFISSISVYADLSRPVDESSPVGTIADETIEDF